MSSARERVPRCARSLLASRSDEEERQSLRSLLRLLETDAETLRQLWTWLQEDGEAGLVDQMTVYLFARSFAGEAALASIFKGETLAVADAIPSLHHQIDGAAAEFQRALDAITQIQWPVKTTHSLCKIAQQVEDPRVRQQTIAFAYGVVQRWVAESPVVWLRAASSILLVGITDVWSAVRKESARAAQRIVVQFPSVELIDSFVESLVKIAGGDAWKAQEGALLTFKEILSAIQSEKTTSDTASSVTNTAAMIKGGPGAGPALVFHIGGRHRALAQLPRSLALKLKPVMYVSLQHAQVSVREAAALCLARYAEICDDSTRILTFQEVMSKLNRLSADADGEPSETELQSAELLDAAEAEGLLDVLAKLVPLLPVQFLVKHWKVVYPTLERYVVHIATSVRLRGSTVVLALAQLTNRQDGGSSPSSATASHGAIALLHQMLLALAQHRSDGGSVCWQRLEGRLLSIDLLVDLLGKDHLWRLSGDHALLHVASYARKRTIEADAWLPDAMICQATWSLDEEEEEPQFARLPTASPSIIDRLNTHSTINKSKPTDLWTSVLGGWLGETRAAFESSQFELRRIARQVLPGLVRLSLWCGQLQLLLAATGAKKADTKAASRPAIMNGWQWSCVRQVTLHAQLLRQSGVRHREVESLMSQSDAFVVEIIRGSSPFPVATGHDEPEAVVARVEALVLVSLSRRSATDAPLFESALLAAATDVHACLPACYQLLSVATASGALCEPSWDRQLSIALVQLLPLVARHAAVRTNAQLWRIVERAALAWLATDDMFRWITIDKAAAQESLLLALSALLSHDDPENASTQEDVELVLRSLLTVAPIQSNPTKRLSDSVAGCLVRIYAALWRGVADSAASKLQTKLILAVAALHHHQQQSVGLAKSTKHEAACSGWDDWDSDGGDELQTAKHEELRPCDAATTDDDALPAVETIATAMARVLTPNHSDAFRVHLQCMLQDPTDTTPSQRERLVSVAAALNK